MEVLRSGGMGRAAGVGTWRYGGLETRCRRGGMEL